MWHGARFSQPTKPAKLHSRSTYAVGRPPRRIRNKWTGYIKWSLYNGKLSQNGKAILSGSNSRTTRRRRTDGKSHRQATDRSESEVYFLRFQAFLMDFWETNHRTRSRVTAQQTRSRVNAQQTKVAPTSPEVTQVASLRSARPGRESPPSRPRVAP